MYLFHLVISSLILKFALAPLRQVLSSVHPQLAISDYMIKRLRSLHVDAYHLKIHADTFLVDVLLLVYQQVQAFQQLSLGHLFSIIAGVFELLPTTDYRLYTLDLNSSSDLGKSSKFHFHEYHAFFYLNTLIYFRLQK